jgi:uncharacterized membrane protein
MEFLAELHPFVVHYPIALLSLYAVLEILGVVIKKKFLSDVAYLLLILGAIGAFLGALTGNQAAAAYKYWNEQSSSVLESHQLFATITIWYSIALVILRTVLIVKNKFVGPLKYLFIVLAIVVLILVYKTGEYGGRMTYDFGVGTSINTSQLK